MAGPWFLKDIQWRKLWGRQDYANWLLTACIVVAVICVTVIADPHVQPYLLWDARISYPLHSELDTIPSWVAVLIPLVMLALTVGMGEFVASKRQHSNVTDATSTFVYFFLDGVQSFIMGLLLTQVFKVTVGRLRPNFLARCNPDVPAGLTFTLQNLTSAIGNQGDQFPCTGSDSDVKDGRLAFVSGHTSLSFNLAVYASGYLIWTWHWRHTALPKRFAFWDEFRTDLVNVLAKTWMLAMLCFAWGIGVSRIIDYQHDAADVVGGALLGTMIALVYLLRAIPRWTRVLDAERASQKDFGASTDTEVPLGFNGAGRSHAHGSEMVSVPV